MSLRPYQVEAIKAARDVVGRAPPPGNSPTRGEGNPLLALATGTGKTRTALELVRGALAKGHRVLWLTGAAVLLRQTFEAAQTAGIEAQIVQAPRRWPAPTPLQIVSWDTLGSRARLFEYVEAMDRRPPKIIVWDEAHEVCAPALVELRERLDLWGAWTGAPIVHVGLSATPETRGLGDLFELAYHYGVREAQDAGYLKRERVIDCFTVNPRGPDRPQQTITPGDPLPHVVRENTRRWLWFCGSVAEAVAARDRCRGEGLAAEVLSATDSNERREQVLGALARGEVQVVCNAALLTTGVDVPAVSGIVFGQGRSAESAPLMRQIVGRGLRPSDDAEDCLIIDCYGNVGRLGLSAVPCLRPWRELEIGEIPGEDAQLMALLAQLDKVLSKKLGEDAGEPTDERKRARAYPPRWLKVAPGVRAVSGGDLGVVMLLDEGEGVRLGWTCRGGSKLYTFPMRGPGVRPEVAEAAARDVLRQAGGLQNPRAVWRQGSPTDKAIGYAEQLGVRWRRGETAGELADRMTIARALKVVSR